MGKNNYAQGFILPSGMMACSRLASCRLVPVVTAFCISDDRKFAPVTIAFFRFALRRSAENKLALLRFAPSKFALMRTIPSRLAPLRSAPARLLLLKSA